MSIGQKTGVDQTRTIDEVVKALAPVSRLRTPRAKTRHQSAIEEMARNLVPLIGRVDATAPDPARAAQVEILRNAVACGRYRPDLRQVAWKLLCEVAAVPRR
jgi:anti-sigma28 factor (negative regulator of flagellin synthesis)